ncbi:MAG: hypothetical protein IH831_01965 [Planctomycetes bacterium]|nr:hypothetical protein [Planctomycetota bacterium]
MQSANWRKNQFRTAGLLPRTKKDEYNRIFGASTFAVEEARVVVLQTLENREKLTQVHFDNVQIEGRILRHNFRETTYTCTPKERTDGFFDELDLPPWDLWIAISNDADNDVLLSWIPQELVDLVDKGVRSSAEENIFWVEDENMFA